MSERGQIEIGSEFGKELTRLAREAETIVEIGPWLGEGSTRCLRRGMNRLSQRLIAIEVCQNSVATASALYAHDPRVAIIHGVVIKPSEYSDFTTHPHPEGKDWYVGEKSLVEKAPYVFHRIPRKVDLLLLDGGEWSTDGDFKKLIGRTKTVVLDDTDQKVSNKNWRNRQWLIESKWKILRDELKDRHGWLVASAP